jgi:hypothetical protein
LTIQIIFCEEYILLSSSLCNFLYCSVTSSLLDPNIILNTLFSNNPLLCSFLSVRNQVYLKVQPVLRWNNEVIWNYY